MDISKIVYPIVGVIGAGVYFFTSFLPNQRLNEFVVLYNEKVEVTQKVFGEYSKSLNIPDSDYQKILISTNKMISEGCPLLESLENQCTEINNDLLSLVGKMYEGKTKGLSENISEYMRKYNIYNAQLTVLKGLKSEEK